MRWKQVQAHFLEAMEFIDFSLILQGPAGTRFCDVFWVAQNTSQMLLLLHKTIFEQNEFAEHVVHFNDFGVSDVSERVMSEKQKNQKILEMT